MTFNYLKTKEFRRMLFVALIGIVASLITYEIIYYINPFSPKTTISWSMAFIIGIIRQHALHRYYTFEYKISYFKSLYKAFVLDFSVLMLTSGLNWVLSETFNLHHRFVWLLCLLSSAIMSLFFIKNYVFQKMSSPK